MEYGNFSKEKFEWKTEDNSDGLIEPYHGSHPEMASDLPGVLLGGYIPGPVASSETEKL